MSRGAPPLMSRFEVCLSLCQNRGSSGLSRLSCTQCNHSFLHPSTADKGRDPISTPPCLRSPIGCLFYSTLSDAPLDTRVGRIDHRVLFVVAVGLFRQTHTSLSVLDYLPFLFAPLY